MSLKEQNIKRAMRLIAKYQENRTYQEKRLDDALRAIVAPLSEDDLAEVIKCSVE